ncbi:MAG: ATPase, T2SS/T4P/T4SS family [Candidatus Micrarchaeota archaeon]
MYDPGWNVDPHINSPYFIEEDFSLDPLESRALESLLLEFMKKCRDSSGVKPDGKTLLALLLGICDKSSYPMQKNRAELLLRLAGMALSGLGVLDLLLKDDSLEEIAVLGPGLPIRVYVRNTGWLDTNCSIASKKYAIACINRIARHLGRRISFASPALSASLPDGSRLHASISPINRSGFEITIRKFSKQPMSLPQLALSGMLSPLSISFLWLAAAADTSILMCGNTGSGKTTFLNSLFSCVPLCDRVVIAEETPEISIPHGHVVRLVSNEQSKISMLELVQNSLRMRPDRVIIGEVKSRSEISALFESLQAGQARGIYATFHSKDSREAANRLFHAGIPSSDLSAIDLLVVLRRISVFSDAGNRPLEIRRVTEISEFTGKAGISRLFAYDPGKDALLPDLSAIKNSALFGKISANYRKSQEGLLSELFKREKWLLALLKEGACLDYASFTKSVQNEYALGH